jgi:hypothetical protein
LNSSLSIATKTDIRSFNKHVVVITRFHDAALTTTNTTPCSPRNIPRIAIKWGENGISW